MSLASEKPEDSHAAPVKSSKSIPAIRSSSAVVVFLLVVAVGLGCDLVSKHYVFETVLKDPALLEQVDRLQSDRPDTLLTTENILHRLRPGRPLCPGVRLTLSTNPGVVFGLPMPRWAVAASTLVAIGLVFCFFATASAKARLVHLALAMVLAGALGNFYDRLFSKVALAQLEPICYHVRDFIDCSQLYYPWVFNVADVLLVAGSALLILHWLGERDGRSRGKTER